VAILVFSLISGAFTFWVGPLFNLLSRKHEYEADAYAAQTTGETHPMKTALRKLCEKNLSTLQPHPLYSRYHYSHPPLLERLAALEKPVDGP
jgi:STE24 endopeptidase